MRRLYTFLGTVVFLSTAAYGQYQQNFDTIVTTTAAAATTYDKLPEGWAIYEVGAGPAADGKYLVANGSNTTGTAYSFGATGSSDRALGTIASNNNFPTLGVIFFNETENPITSVTISYTGEQWRYGGRSGTPAPKDSLLFEYSLDAVGIVNNAGTWIKVPQLDFKSVYTTGASFVVLDGNVAANRQALSHTITGLNIQPGERIVLRWSDANITGNDDGLAVDDFTISAGLAPGTMTSGGTTVGGGEGNGGTTSNNNATSVPIFESKPATDSGFVHLYGNLHGHTTHSDGRASTGTPANAYSFARGAAGMDFLGISEHNHSTAGMAIANYKTGSTQADAANGQPNAAGQPFVALHGMEWGTISGGGHVLVYGFRDSLLNWETGNNDVYIPKGDYLALFERVRANPEGVALLAHPGSSDFTGLTGGYKGVADSAVASVAIESGPAFSTSTTYSDYPSSLAYINYYRSLLKRGYRVGAHMDQDNHELTFGTANGNRIAVLARDRTRAGVLNAIRAMRVYATNDYNAQVNFTIGGYVLGSQVLGNTELTGVVTYTDADGEALTAVQVYGGRVNGSDAVLVQSATGNTSFTTAQAVGETWYYYAVLTQADGNKMVTAPIWVTKTLYPLPVTLAGLTVKASGSAAVLDWQTATELNSSHFIVERSRDLVHFEAAGRVAARGTAGGYSFTDGAPGSGMVYYRLQQVDRDGHVEYSRIVSVNFGREQAVTLAPNPGKGLVWVRGLADDGKPVQVQVVDMAGNRVYNRVHPASNNLPLDLTGLANGFYVVRVGDVLRQVVIQH